MKYAAILLSVFALFPAVAGDVFNVDGGHSSIVFSVKHNNIADFYGRFNKVDGTITYDAGNPTAGSFEITIDAGSVDTNSDRRDKHLRNADFFNAVQFPEVTFKSTSIKQKGDALHVTGDFTMLGKTKPVTFEITVSDTAQGRGGTTLRGFNAKTTIKRSEWGMTYGIGGSLGDEVTIIASLEGIHK
ncbi:MAG: YceI family protein [Acidobacteriota bacterium]|nr:YceI family protein [Acidobacteriota bacterium]